MLNKTITNAQFLY